MARTGTRTRSAEVDSTSTSSLAVHQPPEQLVDETAIRVRYAETDAMGIVHHSHYVVWFEAGRSSYMRHVNLAYGEVERAGFYFRIAELGVRYRMPALYDEVVLVRTWLSEVHSRQLAFAYAVVRPADEVASCPEQVLVTGFTRLICTDRSGQVRRLPADLRTHLQALVVPGGDLHRSHA
ncbi:MAG: acyl-CoA thioesterase [Anaerolineae bacterium]